MTYCTYIIIELGNQKKKDIIISISDVNDGVEN